jgi:hypothetical protein
MVAFFNIIFGVMYVNFFLGLININGIGVYVTNLYNNNILYLTFIVFILTSIYFLIINFVCK